METNTGSLSTFHSRRGVTASCLCLDDVDEPENEGDDFDYRDSEFFDDSAAKQTSPEFEEDDDW